MGQMIRLKRDTHMFNIITHDLQEDATILEIGSGRGEFAAIARSRGFRYIGIEPSAMLRMSLIELGFEILSDPIPPIKLEDDSVDLVYSTQLIEHMENYTTVLEYFQEAKRVLKPGGILISVTPNYDTIGMIFYLFDYQHNFVTNRGRLEHLSQDAGFDHIASRPFLTNIGLSPLAFVDRIFAHIVLFFMRSPLTCSAVHLLVGSKIFCRIYKNLFDQILVISRKP